MDNSNNRADRKASFNDKATRAAAFAVQTGNREINGQAVMAINAYLRTNALEWTEDERDVLLKTAFDIFASAVRGESN